MESPVGRRLQAEGSCGYWLELLHMRVKTPEFLLVTTHTGSTPASLDLAAVQKRYPGCKGHYEVGKLSNGTGLAALEEKILELSAAFSGNASRLAGPLARSA